MNLLAFDTSTETLFVAVSRHAHGQSQVWDYSGTGGAQASYALIAQVQRLLGLAELRLDQLNAICFGCGPGSFTGLRSACAVAQGLAFGAGVPVLPISSLMAVAEAARLQGFADPTSGKVLALLDARIGEMYCGEFAFTVQDHNPIWTQIGSSTLCKPADFALSHAAQSPAYVLAGNVFDTYAQELQGLGSTALCVNALPSAHAMLRLAPQLLAQGRAVPAHEALPTYIRDKVAQTSAERAALKATLAA